ncbi:MAG: alpha/beta hydrolase [Rhodobacter sp.]|nr:alpha/beta hydrolase [Rhodobacter sp.]
MSWQLRGINLVSRNVVKPVLRHQHDVTAARRRFAAATRLFCPSPPLTAVLADNTVPGDWIWSGPVKSGAALLYLHGGGYVVGSPATHRALVARLSRLTGLRAFAPDYRLAPEHPYPAALQDVTAAFQHLVDRGYPPSSIVLSGDSAGGGLALALLATLCQRGTRPAATVVFSPWTDLALTGASMRENAAHDVLFAPERADELCEMVAGDAPRTDPFLSPLYARFPGCPPVLLQYSASELLRDDARRMTRRLQEFGADVTETSLPDAPHVWQLLARYLPEARQSLAEAATFISAQLRAPRPGGS